MERCPEKNFDLEKAIWKLDLLGLGKMIEIFKLELQINQHFDENLLIKLVDELLGQLYPQILEDEGYLPRDLFNQIVSKSAQILWLSDQDGKEKQKIIIGNCFSSLENVYNFYAITGGGNNAIEDEVISFILESPEFAFDPNLPEIIKSRVDKLEEKYLENLIAHGINPKVFKKEILHNAFHLYMEFLQKITENYEDFFRSKIYFYILRNAGRLARLEYSVKFFKIFKDLSEQYAHLLDQYFLMFDFNSIYGYSYAQDLYLEHGSKALLLLLIHEVLHDMVERP